MAGKTIPSGARVRVTTNTGGLAPFYLQEAVVLEHLADGMSCIIRLDAGGQGKAFFSELQRLTPSAESAPLSAETARIREGGDEPLFEVEGLAPWTDGDQRDAQSHGWELTIFSDRQICIVADEEDEQERFSGGQANIVAAMHVEHVAGHSLDSDTYPPGYVELCRRALKVTEATLSSETEDDDGRCVACGCDLADPSAAGAEDGMCGECIG